MKRIISVILVLSIFVSFTSFSFAAEEEHTNETFLFRDLPWGISYREAMELLNVDTSKEGTSEESWRDYGEKEKMSMLFYRCIDENGEYDSISDDWYKCECDRVFCGYYDVAGYKNVPTYLEFIDNKLTGARYEFENSSRDATNIDLDSLKEKLTKLYGTPDKYNPLYVIGSNYGAEWDADDGSCIMLGDFHGIEDIFPAPYGYSFGNYKAILYFSGDRQSIAEEYLSRREGDFGGL